MTWWHKYNQYIYGLGACLLLFGCEKTPEITLSFVQRADMPAPRASACVATEEDQAYIIGGRDEKGHYLNDIWVYDATADQWSLLTTIPGAARVKASAYCVHHHLYVGLGFAQNAVYSQSAYLTDWWEYSLETKQWTALASFPSANTVSNTVFYQDSSIYAMYGMGSGFCRDIYQYYIPTNTWRLLPDNTNRHRSCMGGTGAQCQGLAYFGTGFDTHMLSDWFEFDLSSDRWTKKASLPGKARVLSSATATNEYVYLFGGRYFAGEYTGGEVFDTYLRYHPKTNQWTWCGQMPHRAENMIAFTLHNQVYFGLGEDENGTLINRLYRIE